MVRHQADGVKSLTGYLYANSTFKTLEYWAVALKRLPFLLYLLLFTFKDVSTSLDMTI